MCEGLKTSARECGDEEKDNNRGDPWSGFDLWTVGVQLDIRDVGVGVLIDVFDVLGDSEVGHADGLLLEDTVQKATQTTIRILVAFAGKWSHKLFIIKTHAREFFTGTEIIRFVIDKG